MSQRRKMFRMSTRRKDQHKNSHIPLNLGGLDDLALEIGGNNAVGMSILTVYTKHGVFNNEGCSMSKAFPAVPPTKVM